MDDPFIIREDFNNMIRFAWEKSTDNVNQTWMHNFNELIRDNALKGLQRKVNKFTWSNK
jgi:hypothetical protein